jgi:hypothetical protein
MGSKYLKRGKTERESETPVLGESNLAKNLRIPWRNQETASGGLGGGPP